MRTVYTVDYSPLKRLSGTSAEAYRGRIEGMLAAIEEAPSAEGRFAAYILLGEMLSAIEKTAGVAISVAELVSVNKEG